MKKYILSILLMCSVATQAGLSGGDPKIKEARRLRLIEQQKLMEEYAGLSHIEIIAKEWEKSELANWNQYIENFLKKHSSNEQNQNPETIYVISGIPLVSKEDTSGGFGDVASNYIGALELKKKFPESKITLVVTTLKNLDKKFSNVNKSDSIIKTLAPKLDINLVDTLQEHKGIQIIFLSKDPFEITENDLDILKILPKGDLALQFSANKSGFWKLANTLGKIAFDFTELSETESSHIVAKENSPEHYRDLKIHATYPAGPGLGGVYYINQDFEKNNTLISTWLQNIHHITSIEEYSKLNIGFIYSKNTVAINNYIKFMNQLALNNPTKNYLLVLPEGNEIKFFPKNLNIYFYKNLNLELSKALIQNSKIPPLVTGDSSLSMALSSLKSKIFFFYDLCSWKIKLKNDLQIQLEKYLNPNSVNEFKKIFNLYFGIGIEPFSDEQIKNLVNISESEIINKQLASARDLLMQNNNIFDFVKQLYYVHKTFLDETPSSIKKLIPHLGDKLLNLRTFNSIFQNQRSSILRCEILFGK